ncbi:permease prefix domain 1-containing protein [Paenibacillus sp. MMS20-IR301]|uniref:permease prefix domain 1-containing protein n=1 Tax=Paenibacillus sp. MMS20-IR301 TaxID=2895946 RepID=UPI0028EDA244|nr:permease prefix domain 1-containing protein [Paenibacillus sp. MMS20-IR301]WNS41896.1 permease prefix domain 1-containing protein [Paenibacillus sp. MMS20-IR301]
METIIGYLNTMFASLPGTQQMQKLKQELLGHMEEKYHELKHEGKSENEAVGIVISEFGNIDELISELGIEPASAKNGINRTEELLPPLRVLTGFETEEFIAAKTRAGLLVGLGVALCMIGTALLILITSLAENGFMRSYISEDALGVFGVVTLLVLLVPAIAMFIYSGMKMEKYKFIQSGFSLPHHLQAEIEQKQSSFAATYTLSLITGVGLCILSTVAIFVASAFGDTASTYGIVVLLAVVAVAVFLFVYYGNIRGAYQLLLKTGEFTDAKKEENRVIGAVAAIVWPLVTCIFLISGLVYNQWQINWILFPVTGILFGVFSAAYNILKGKDAA